MDVRDVVLLGKYLQELYGEKFPALTDGMIRLWFRQMQAFDNTLMNQAVERWASQHNIRAPNLDELLDQAEFLQDEHKRATRRQDSKSLADILRAAGEAQATNPERAPQERTFGCLMSELAIRSVERWQDEQGTWHPKLTLEGRAAQCYEWARSYETHNPWMRDELLYQARTYAAMAHKETTR